MPRKIYDMLDLPQLEKCYYDVPIVDVAKKKPLGRIVVGMTYGACHGPSYLLAGIPGIPMALG
jgi:hypothetical protein